MLNRRTVVMCAMLAALAVGSALLPASASAQSAPSWAVPDMVAKAKAEGGTVTVYSSVNEQEALPLWKDFEAASGIKVEYVRASDTALIGRIALEARAQQRSWDILMTTAVGRLPQDFLAAVEPPQAAGYDPTAIGPGKKWYGVYSNFNAPSFNTTQVKPGELPTSYEGFAAKKEWAGKTAIDVGDTQWLAGMFQHYGEDKARRMLGEIVAALKPVIVDGHLALARQVGLGEYAVTLNNYLNLTNNVRMSGGPTDYWVLEPVVVFYGQVGVSARAPHPNTALLATNFLLSKEGQQKLTHAGRIPVRKDVIPNPPDVFKRLEGRKVVPVNFGGEDEKRVAKAFQEIFKGR